MVDPGKLIKESTTESPVKPALLLQGILFGFIFGFLLQKGGVAKFHILLGQLLLQDFTVVKVMLTAIVVGMLGITALNAHAKVNLHIKPTKLGSNIIGGLLFGFGFALLGYCPGTGAAALGEGNWDALFGVAGLITGSYLYAEFSGFLDKTVGTWGEKGKLLLPDLFHMPRGIFVIVFACLLTGLLLFLRRIPPN
jgi:uncharacterized membrane protein YedE/YeeE